MATYKKRGYKVKPEKIKEDPIEAEVAAEELESTTAEVFNTLDETANKTEEWVAENQKYIFGVVGGLALIVLIYLGFQKFVQEPKEETAANEIFQAQQYFKEAQEANLTDKDSLYNLALNGGNGKQGFIDIINEYSGTKTAKVASYYAGFAYLSQEKYDEAINYLDQYSGDDYILNALAQGGIGDAFAQLGQDDQALEYYQKALNEEENNFTTPKFLLKSAKLALSLGKADVAVKSLEQIEMNYPDSSEYNEVEVLLAKAKASL